MEGFDQVMPVRYWQLSLPWREVEKTDVHTGDVVSLPGAAGVLPPCLPSFETVSPCRPR